MSIQEIKKALSRTFQGMLKNIVSLANDSSLESEYKVLKVGDESTPIEISRTKVKINSLDTNELTVKGASVQTLVPFVKTAQFQDDIGTTQHYIPFNNLAEQSSIGSENIGFIAPFDLKLQKVEQLKI